MNEYLNAGKNFPWNYNYNNKKINNKNIVLHELLLVNEKKEEENKKKIKKLKEYNINDVKKKFIKKFKNKRI